MVFWPHLIPMLTIMREVVRVLWPAEDQSSWYSAWRWLTSPTWNLQKVIITLKKTDFLYNFIFKKVTSKNIFFVTLASELKIADNFLTINGNRQYGCFVSSLLRLSSVHITSLSVKSVEISWTWAPTWTPTPASWHSSPLKLYFVVSILKSEAACSSLTHLPLGLATPCDMWRDTGAAPPRLVTRHQLAVSSLSSVTRHQLAVSSLSSVLHGMRHTPTQYT